MEKANKIYYNFLNKLNGLETSVHQSDANTVAFRAGSRELKSEWYFLRNWLTDLKEEIRKMKLNIASNIKISVINNMQTKFILEVKKNGLFSDRMNKLEQSVLMLRYRIHKLLSLAS